MNIDKLDLELSIKIKETFKEILKKIDCQITIDYSNNDLNIIELIKLEKINNIFLLYKKYEIEELIEINHKYDFILKNKLKTDDNLLLKLKNISKKWFFLKLFLGKIYKINKLKTYYYIMVYNSIIVELTKLEYDKLSYYSKYVYKLQQLLKLNNELNINQEFKIIFEDDIKQFNLNDKFEKNFNGIIKIIDSEIKYIFKK
jgi:hypothetical protein